VPVTTARHVLRLRIEVRPPIWKAAANILNKQSCTADKGWYSSLGVGCGKVLTVKMYRVTIYNLVPHTGIDPLLRAQDRDSWEAPVNAGMKFCFP